MWNTIYWVLFVLAVGAFYIGLRSEEYQIHYTVMALALWGGAFWVNKKMKEQKNED